MILDDINTIGIVGAGQMGRGIAHVCVTAGYRVILMDVTDSVLDEALNKMRAGFERAVEHGAISQEHIQAALALIQPSSRQEDLQHAEMIIEAVPEDAALKRDLFTKLGRLCAPETILASNTSSISITQLAAAAGRPERVIGMHFMNPVPVMRLVEVVRGRQTRPETVTLVVDLARRLGKVPVVSQDVPGFIVNRILMPMINEAIFAAEAGVGSAEDIDLAMRTGANHPVGPLALADRIGLDTVLAICDVLHRDLQDPKFRPCPLLRRYVEAGRLGRKTGHGFYSYAAQGERQEAMSRTP